MIESRWCPACGEENLPHRRFCRVCGASLDFRCPDCGFLNLVGDRYCGGCARPLVDAGGQPVEPWQEDARLAAGRRFVLPDALRDRTGALAVDQILDAENLLATIVKADLSGFTAMSELLGDPEEVTVIMNQVFDPLVGVVRRYGGHIDNYAGDMIIAFFGAPTTLERSAERAVRAALEMRAEVARLNDKNISHGVELGISTGVATGYGLWSEVGFGAHARRTISGELGDYAALLEKFADRGTVGICPDTYDRVAAAIPAQPQSDTVSPPGGGEARPVYYAELPNPPRSWLEAHPTGRPPLAERDQELTGLIERWELVAAGGGLRAVALTGERGLGKSRLAAEFAAAVAAEGGRVVAAGASSLARPLGEDLLARLRRSLWLAHSLNPDDEAGVAAWAASRGVPASGELPTLLAACAATEPLLVIVDGLHHAPPLPPEFLTDLAEANVLLVLITRDTTPLERLEAAADLVETVSLPPLSETASAALIESLQPTLATPELPALLARLGEGNPLFLLDWHRLLTQAGEAATNIDWERELWRLPPLVQEECDRLIDELEETARAVLYAAAALADEGDLSFAPGAVGFLTDAAEWAAMLARIERSGILDRQEEPLRLRFRHRAMRQVCLRRLSESVRGALLARASEARLRLRQAELTGGEG